MISLSSTEITFIADGVVHSLAFIGRTRTATVRLVISLLDFPSVESSILCAVRGVSMEFFEKSRGVGVSSDTLEKHSGVRNTVDESVKLDDEPPKSRCPIVRGVTFDALVTVDDVELRNSIDGVCVALMVVVDLLLVAANLVPRANGGVSVNAVLSTSSLFTLSRSRKSHADDCLINFGFAIDIELFFVVLVLMVARLGDADTIGVDCNLECDDAPPMPINFEYFEVGVFRVDIFD